MSRIRMVVKHRKTGYLFEYRPTHPFAHKKSGRVFQHRLVAEKHHLTQENSIEINGGLYLRQGFEVHHKNRIKTDNRPENLQILTSQEHSILHKWEEKNGTNPMPKEFLESAIFPGSNYRERERSKRRLQTICRKIERLEETEAAKLVELIGRRFPHLVGAPTR